MLGPAEIIRAARLAVARYGAEAVRVQDVLQTVMAAQARGEAADLLDELVHAELLSARQARDLRNGLDQTQVDPETGDNLKDPNGAPRAGGAKSASPAEQLGQHPRIAGFRILRRLGEGGMGSVFLAYDARDNRQVALKVLAAEHATVQSSLDRFRREGTSGLSLDHPNVVRSFGAGQDEATGLNYLVLEYVDGPSGHDLVERFGRLKVGDAVHIVLDVARALAHAHSRAIIHRDIKPANILLTQAGRAKLSDLGLAKRTDEASHLTSARQGVGTPYYMPYEQALNAKAADTRSDLFALGATLYHLLTGDVPFPGAGPVEVMERKDAGIFLPARALNSDVPDSLERILARLLARKPEQRYASAAELIVDLERTQLAPAVPSFVDLDLALRDPVVRERLASTAQPTAVDMVSPAANAHKVPETAGYWFLRFKDRHGRLCKSKLTQAQVLQRLRAGKLSARVEAARSTQADFRPITTYSEFRDAAPASRAVGDSGRTAKLTPARRRSIAAGFVAWVPWSLVIAVALGAGILALTLLILLRH
jgi:eukaryotic-like serine/threonine-protein kinase